jgi:hypothetical protein
VAVTNFAKSPSVSLARDLYIYSIYYSIIRLCIPSDHISSLVDVGHTEEETLDARDPLSEMRLWIVSVV